MQGVYLHYNVVVYVYPTFSVQHCETSYAINSEVMWLQCMKWLQESRCRHDLLENICIVQSFSYCLRYQTFTPVMTFCSHDGKMAKSCVSLFRTPLPANTRRNKHVIITLLCQSLIITSWFHFVFAGLFHVGYFMRLLLYAVLISILQYIKRQ